MLYVFPERRKRDIPEKHEVRSASSTNTTGHLTYVFRLTFLIFRSRPRPSIQSQTSKIYMHCFAAEVDLLKYLNLYVYMFSKEDRNETENMN